MEVCELYTRVVGETEWGENLLGRGESISDGESRLWQVAPGDYDLLAKDCAGNQLSAEQDVPIRESYDWVIPLAVQPGGAQLTVHNLCGGPIFGLYCTDCEGLSAVNLIEGDPIDRGESRTLSIPEEGFRVFEARDADDLWLDFWVILLEEGETATWDVCSL